MKVERWWAIDGKSLIKPNGVECIKSSKACKLPAQQMLPGSVDPNCQIITEESGICQVTPLLIFLMSTKH
jgi:hypothetical protein